MKSIELHNFKKFEFLPEIKLGKVNFLVGKNNSGKSSFIRAIQTIDNVVEDCSHIDFRWGADGCVENVGCVFPLYHDETKMTTFNNYLYDKATDDVITIKYTTTHRARGPKAEDYEATVIMKIEDSYKRSEGKIEDGYKISEGKIIYLYIEDNYTGITMELDFKKDTSEFTFKPNDCDIDFHDIIFKSRYPLEKQVERTIKMSFPLLLGKCASILPQTTSKNLAFRLDDIIGSLGFDELGYQDDVIMAQIQEIHYLKFKLNALIGGILRSNTRSIYIPTSIIRAKNLYDICDKNDVLASIISQYVQSGYTGKEFIEKWMRNFGIGETFRTPLLKGQCYSIIVKDKEGVEKNLSELGTGSVRLMALLLQIGTIIKTEDEDKEAPDYKEEIKRLVLIEEPEQNLHPALQSKLADFFESVPNTQFIVETHSEYIIRRSQVLVAKKGYKTIEETNEKSPFVVYYFPDSKDLIPYKMQYQPSGRFLLDFGEGFFDAAANIAIELAKIERENRKN